MPKKSTLLLVAAVALIGEDGRVLMQRRPIDKQHGGLWEFPGGKLEPGETPEMAAIREIEEELGIVIPPETLIPLTFAGDNAGMPSAGARPIVIMLYICHRWTGEPQCRDGEELRWFAPSALSGLEMPPLDRPLAQRLISLI